MRRRIIIVGDSSLSFLIAKFLDEKCGPLTHLDIVYLSRDDKLIFWPDLQSLLGQKQLLTKKNIFEYLDFRVEKVRSLNLREQRLITDRKVYSFDYLVLDRTPIYTIGEIEKVKMEFLRLLTYLQSMDKQGRRRGAQIRIKGLSAYSWQLALSMAFDLRAMKVLGRVKVFAETTPNLAQIRQFLRDNYLDFREQQEVGVGFQVAAPSSPVNSRTVRGAQLDQQTGIITNAFFCPENHPNIFVIDSPVRSLQNIWRVNRTLASLITDNLLNRLENRRLRVIETLKPALLLKTADSLFLQLGNITSGRVRARLAYKLDRRTFYRLTKS